MLLQELRPELLQELSLNACLNGKAFLIEHGELLEFVGNRTECALLVLARKWGINYQKVRAGACAVLGLACVPAAVCYGCG
jgi:Ca2+-transporting ATPase